MALDKIQVLAASRSKEDVEAPSLQEFIALTKTRGFARTDRFMVELMGPPSMPRGNWSSRDLALLCEDAVLPGKTIRTRDIRINALTERRAHTMEYMSDSVVLTFIVDTSWQTRMFFESWMRLCIGASEAHLLGVDQTAVEYPSREIEFYGNYIQNITITSLTPFLAMPELTALGSINPFIDSSVVQGWRHALDPNNLKVAVESNLEGLTNKIPGNILGQSVSRVVREGIVNPLKKQIGLGHNPRPIPEHEDGKSEEELFRVVLHEAFPVSIDSQPLSSNSANQFHRLRVGFVFKWYSLPTLNQLLNDELVAGI